MVKKSTFVSAFNNIGFFLVLSLIFIILISIVLSFNGVSNNVKKQLHEECYEKCRMDGNSIYSCNKTCNPTVYKTNKLYNNHNYGERLLSHDENLNEFNGPIQKEEQFRINPLPSEPYGKNGPIEPTNNNFNLVDPIDQPKVYEPEPATPNTIAETFII